MLKPNRTKQAILGFLTWKPMSGYDIKKFVDQSISNFWSESYGQIYPILKRLAAEGLARQSVAETAGGRSQHLYSITEVGRAELRRWLAEPAEPDRVRNELLLKLFFGRQVDLETNIRHIENFREQQLRLTARYAGIGADLRTNRSDHPDLPYWLLTLRCGEQVRRAMIDWCDEALRELEGLTPEPEVSGRKKGRGAPRPAVESTETDR